ncbi:MAG: type II toxin-antitoxin system VapC family toxin [Gemmatimonadaceae bacterium]
MLIDYLNGSTKARTELDRFEKIYMSVISWMEILIGTAEGDEESEVRAFLRRFQVYSLDEGVAERTVEIRRREKIRLPDAVIWATAQRLGLLLVTRNSRDFPSRDPGIRIPYKL